MKKEFISDIQSVKTNPFQAISTKRTQMRTEFVSDIQQSAKNNQSISSYLNKEK